MPRHNSVPTYLDIIVDIIIHRRYGYLQFAASGTPLASCIRRVVQCAFLLASSDTKQQQKQHG